MLCLVKNTAHDVLVFRAHLFPYCSVESRVLECFLHTLRMILPCSCLHGVLT